MTENTINGLVNASPCSPEPSTIRNYISLVDASYAHRRQIK